MKLLALVCLVFAAAGCGGESPPSSSEIANALRAEYRTRTEVCIEAEEAWEYECVVEKDGTRALGTVKCDPDFCVDIWKNEDGEQAGRGFATP
jgi:hypothetical protein